MRVNIVCGEINAGWIYGRFYRELKKYSASLPGVSVVTNEKDQAKYDIVHFIPYYEYHEGYAHGSISTAWFSHREEKRKDLKDAFSTAAQGVDAAFSHSKKYADLIKENNWKPECDIYQVVPGVGNEFKAKLSENKKLTVGYVGRSYISTDRKNTSFVNMLAQVCRKNGIDFKITGGKMDYGKIPNFYAQSHLIVSPATIEGGPMSLLEAIKCGKPFLCLDGVGMADEFEDDFPGVIAVGNEEDIVNTILKFDFKKYNRMNMLSEISSHPKIRTWEEFAKDHFNVWQALYSERRKK